jgi:hypothetical protein
VESRHGGHDLQRGPDRSLASSSWAVGVPHTAMTASPMNFSTVPPWRLTTSVAVSK